MKAVSDSAAALRVERGIWSFIDSLAARNLRRNYTVTHVAVRTHTHLHAYLSHGTAQSQYYKIKHTNREPDWDPGDSRMLL